MRSEEAFDRILIVGHARQRHQPCEMVKPGVPCVSKRILGPEPITRCTVTRFGGRVPGLAAVAGRLPVGLIARIAGRGGREVLPLRGRQRGNRRVKCVDERALSVAQPADEEELDRVAAWSGLSTLL